MVVVEIMPPLQCVCDVLEIENDTRGGRSDKNKPGGKDVWMENGTRYQNTDDCCINH